MSVRKKYIALLNEAGVPEELHEEALTSLLYSRKKFWLDLLWFKLTAPIVCIPAVMQTKWEDEKFPHWARHWDNNISMNGDANPWAWVTEDNKTFTKRIAAPLDKNVFYNENGGLLCYYRKGKHHVREKMSRYIFCGTRNPGAGRALHLGHSVAGQIREIAPNDWEFAVHKWEEEPIDEMVGGIRVLCLGKDWQITKYKPWFSFKLFGKKMVIGSDKNIGFKINNIQADYHPLDKDARLNLCHSTVPYLAKEKK